MSYLTSTGTSRKTDNACGDKLLLDAQMQDNKTVPKGECIYHEKKRKEKWCVCFDTSYKDYNMSNALVTAIGSFSSDIVIKSLKALNYYVVGLNVNPKEWIAESLLVDRFYQVPYITKQDDYIMAIKEICINERITHLIPLTDSELDVLNDLRDWFSEKNIKLCITSQKSVEIARNKYSTYQFAKRLSDIVNVIPTYLKKDILDAKDILSFPIIAKPINGRSSQGIIRLETKLQLDKLLNNRDLENYIFQPIIEGDVVTVDTIRDYTGFCYAVARKELLRTLNGAGVSVYVFHNEQLENICQILANKMDVIGCVNFEFLLDANGKFWLIECNPRFSGGVKFSKIAAYDMISNHIRVFDKIPLDKPKEWSNQYIARKYEEYVTKIE